ncbi:hypothetical protein OSB04_032199 [Centaurea solstitialis]|uniref:Uncharacterized protein n=1 Tax=Centaurea solstitialis TaxID=347529 RepID=A0AA38W8V7_9ASTR|nr:hypothetical protein OSB04_032199 [Centaurea solstitialis]
MAINIGIGTSTFLTPPFSSIPSHHEPPLSLVELKGVIAKAFNGCGSTVGNILKGQWIVSLSTWIRSGGNRRRHPSSWVDLWAGHGRGYGPVTISMVERISWVPEWTRIPLRLRSRRVGDAVVFGIILSSSTSKEACDTLYRTYRGEGKVKMISSSKDIDKRKV